MLYTFSQAVSRLRQYAGNGSCKPDVVKQYINDALERLMEAEQWKDLQHTMRFCVRDAVFPVPFCVQTVLAAAVNGTPVSIFGPMYQYLSSGPGDLDWTRRGGSADLVDLGDMWATMYDIPASATGYQLCAFSRVAGDATKSLTVHGFDVRGEEVREALTVSQWAGGQEGNVYGAFGAEAPVTTHRYTQVGRLILPENLQGYVSIYAVDQTHGVVSDMRLLAKCHPQQTIPQFRRYRFNAMGQGDMTGDRSENSARYVTALVKLRYMPLVEDDDIVPLDGLQAIKLIMMAIAKEEANDVTSATALEGRAVALLLNKQQAKVQALGFPVMLSSTYRTSFGRFVNHRGGV